MRLRHAIGPAMALCTLMWTGVAHGVERLAGVPACVRPFDAFNLLRPEGLLTTETWPEVEAALLAHVERVEREVDPPLLALEAATGRQHWLNWPALKPARDRSLQAAATDAARQADAAFFEDLTRRLPAHSDAIGRAHAAWTRQTVPMPSGLPHRAAVDLVAAVASVPLTTDDSAGLGEPLARWARQDAAHRDACMTAHREAMDAFDRGLAGLHIDVIRDYQSRMDWLPKAYDLWTEIAKPLGRTLDLVARDQEAAIEEICSRVSGEASDRLRQVLMSRSLRTFRYDTPQPPAEEFVALLAAPNCTADQAEAIKSIRMRWLPKEIALLRQMQSIARRSKTPSWPLFGSGWEEPTHQGEVESSIRSLDERRTENDAIARAELETLLGNGYRPMVSAGVGQRSAEGAATAPERWDPSPFALSPDPAADRLRLRFDPGPLSKETADRIARDVGLDADQATWWQDATSALHRDASERVKTAREQPNAPGVLRSGWTFTSEGGYRFDASVSQELLHAANAQASHLREREEELFDELARRCGPRARLAVERALRAVTREVAAVRRGVRRCEDLRDLATPDRLVHEALAAAPQAAERLVPVLGEWAALARTRSAALEESLHRECFLEDRRMWSRGEEGERVQRELAVVTRDVDMTDREHRTRIVAVQERLLQEVLAMAPDAATRRRYEELWLHETFPALFAAMPPARAALDRARAASPGDERIEALAEVWIQRDGALTRDLVSAAIASASIEAGDAARWSSYDRERNRLSERRRFVSDLAMVALRIRSDGSSHGS